MQCRPSVTQWASRDRDWETEARGGKAPRQGRGACEPRALLCCISNKPLTSQVPRTGTLHLLKRQGPWGPQLLEPPPWRHSGDTVASPSSSPTGFPPTEPELLLLHSLHKRGFPVSSPDTLTEAQGSGTELLPLLAHPGPQKE